MQAVYLCLRRSYIIPAAQVFCLNKFKKLHRIAKYHREFQKVKKHMDKFDVQTEIRFKKE